MHSSKQRSRIREYYKNKSIFITGATGFIGKVLLEKLLRSCPDVKNIYVLLRTKKELTPEKRLEKIFSQELFSKLKNEAQNDRRSKVKMVTGDVTELNLGLSETDRKLLVDDVNVFFHIAASVRFDDPLQKALIINTRGTREACNLALEMKNIEMFFHVSTTYCNLNREIVGEELYPPIANWKEMIDIAENMDLYDLQQIMPKLMGPFPNTYTFTKNLAEHVVGELCDGRIPATILRPSIIISSKDDPFPGWIDNFNGPAGLLVGCGKGILRVNWANEKVRMDYLPVDYLVKALIAIVSYRITREDNESLKKLQVYNASSDLKYAITMKRLVEFGKAIVDDIPLKNPLWYPGGNITTSKTYYFIQILLIHLLPAFFVDIILRILGHKPMLFRIQRKIYVANTALQYFINKEWMFINEKVLEVRQSLIPEDYEDFHVELEVDHEKFFRNAAIGAKKYLLHEDMNELDADRKRTFKMKIVYYVTKTIFWLYIFYILYSHLYLIKCALHHIGTYFYRLKV